MKLAKLINRVNQIKKISSSMWKKSLTKRKIEELRFHDRDKNITFQNQAIKNNSYEQFYGNMKYYKTTERSKKYVENWIKLKSRDKIFLDYACGNGESAILAAKSGASLSLGLDLSVVSIKNAKKIADKNNLQNIIFFQADAENTKLPENSIDIIVCSCMLHHLDLSYAFHELRRILKPGGIILAYESLNYNPALKLYRFLTPEMRTDWEKKHILNLKDIEFAKKFFDIGEIRYWHVFGYIAGKFPILSKLLEFVDFIFEKIPFIQLMSWVFTFELIKRKEK
jgi:SAM-dependent methyltransferase